MSKKTKKGGQFEQWSPWEPEVKSVFVLLFSLFFLALPAVSVGLKKKRGNDRRRHRASHLCHI